MAPLSNMRKSSATTTMTLTEPPSHPLVSSLANSAPHPRRTASGRAVRTNTTRPTNYYARPFGSISTAADNESAMPEPSAATTPGFFPGLQYFSDAVTALPKDVMRQFTLLKEVEAKLHGPQEQMSELLDDLLAQPVPMRKPTTDSVGGPATVQGLMSFTANNSARGSAVPSLVNGVAGQNSAHTSMVGSLIGEDLPVETSADRARRQQYQELMSLSREMLQNLDEKNVVLAEANRVIAQQEIRIESVWPQIENEISEEARLGSMTHWAYSDNRQKKQTTGGGGASRRDVAAANSLVAAASVIREADIAQARKEAGREAAREKVKGRRAEAAADSDFDDKPKKSQKLAKGKASANAAAAAAGLGISTNGEPVTKRKKGGDKTLGGTGMERTASGSGRGGKIRETARSTLLNEPGVKKSVKAKPGPLSRRRVPSSAQASPMLVSSPLAPTFNVTSMEPPGGRPQSARLRTNSSATNLRHEKVQEVEPGSRPSTATARPSEKLSGKRKAPDMVEELEGSIGEEQIEKRPRETAEELKHEDMEMADAGPESRSAPSRSGSSHKNSGRNSKVGTPRRQDSFPDNDGTPGHIRDTRARSGAPREAREDSSSSEPFTRRTGKHQRAISNSHLVKQLAPFNRSPDLDRHRDRDDMEVDIDFLDAKNVENGDRMATDEDREDREEKEEKEEHEENEDEARETRRASTRRPPSRRNTTNTLQSSPAPISRALTPVASPPPNPTRSRTHTTASQVTAPEPEIVEPELVEEEEDEEESEHDPDDPNEDKYCYCNRGSYGEMVACDNDNCPMEWFHLGCTELREAPGKDEAWYCRECRPLFTKGRTTKSRGGRG